MVREVWCIDKGRMLVKILEELMMTVNVQGVEQEVRALRLQSTQDRREAWVCDRPIGQTVYIIGVPRARDR